MTTRKYACADYLYVQDSDGLVIRAAEYILSRGMKDDASYPILMAVEGHQTDPLWAAAAMEDKKINLKNEMGFVKTT
jgi:hypothetical protein